MPTTQAVPEGFGTVTVHLWLKDCAKAIEFYGRAFGAETLVRKNAPDGKVMHALLRIGNSMVILADEWPDSYLRSPATAGCATAGLWIYVEDVDGAFQRAVDAGAEVIEPVMDAFWGDRMGHVKDPFGHSWAIATHKEDLSDEEIDRRAVEWFSSQAGR